MFDTQPTDTALNRWRGRITCGELNPPWHRGIEHHKRVAGAVERYGAGDTRIDDDLGGQDVVEDIALQS